MLFNLRTAAAAALAFMAVPSFATNAGDIVGSIHALTAKAKALHDTCSSVYSGPQGGYAIDDKFTEVVVEAKACFEIVKTAHGYSAVYTEEESIKITEAWNDCLGEHEKVVVFLKESTTVFEKSAKVIVDFSQQLVEIFGHITDTLQDICPPQKPHIQELWPPVQNNFQTCISEYGGKGGWRAKRAFVA
ncbi:hypothetical protein BFW01_g5240 [Lasiodiplodia theobromae]|uniref:Uncharacterized protein n=1 Tax=Lasiodiplodia theobromae TaxID=45133 RepID=A0A5N5D1H6_9PEZI|nr:uncharacterized protein LTHEOB_1882 [Lasiodiplodia theobromae]KAB2571535.1 hypothetical protein DBV05_g9806 [Lasiodiplodia theobromae]KAF4536121.1 hypothetical protein LTHEOB_1882 [Lasiodiplodia theobromae]KAF9634345.1 hypothetical protein BFW01_g5240 [Lasiodiplodia theobromae]